MEEAEAALWDLVDSICAIGAKKGETETEVFRGVEGEEEVGGNVRKGGLIGREDVGGTGEGRRDGEADEE